MIWHAPQILFLGVICLSLGILLANNTPNVRNFYYHVLATIFLYGLYIWGGFFHEFDIPQLIFIALTGIGFGVEIAKNGKFYTFKVDSFIAILIIIIGLLYWGGFWDGYASGF